MNNANKQPDSNDFMDAELQEFERSEPKIYVASLSDYNAGRLHGTWLNADADYEALAAGVDEMLARSPEPGAEEWAIHDYEHFGGLRLSEYEPLSIVSAIARGIAEHGPSFAAWANFVNHDVDRLAHFEDAYRGNWASVVAYARDLFDDLGVEAELDGSLGEHLRPYVKVDYDGFARDLELGGDIWIAQRDDGTVDVFDADE